MFEDNLITVTITLVNNQDNVYVGAWPFLGEEGEISDVVETPRGFHIVQLVKISRKSFEESKKSIRRLLEEQEPRPLEKQRFRMKLRKDARIEM